MSRTLYRVTQENSIENSVQDCLSYILRPMVHATLLLAYPKQPCVCLKVNMCFNMLYNIILSELSILFPCDCDIIM